VIQKNDARFRERERASVKLREGGSGRERKCQKQKEVKVMKERKKERRYCVSSSFPTSHRPTACAPFFLGMVFILRFPFVCHHVSLFLNNTNYRPPFFGPPRGGVIGRPDSAPPYEYFDFFSAGFKIWNEHMSVSSTDIIAPALSNSPQ